MKNSAEDLRPACEKRLESMPSDAFGRSILSGDIDDLTRLALDNRLNF